MDLIEIKKQHIENQLAETRYEIWKLKVTETELRQQDKHSLATVCKVMKQREKIKLRQLKQQLAAIEKERSDLHSGDQNKN